MRRRTHCIFLAMVCLNGVAVLLFLRARVVWPLSIVALEGFAGWSLVAYRRVSNSRRTACPPTRPHLGKPPIVGPSALGRTDARFADSEQWFAWRRAAQDVTRSWHEWSAADHEDRADRFGRYTRALAAEERAAAELEIAAGVAFKAAPRERKGEVVRSRVSHLERSG